MTSELQLDEFLLDSIAASLDLRKPNRDAAESVVAEISQALDVEGFPGTYTAIVDAATAVGKTYTMAAIIDYLAMARGWSDFVIVTPGRIVRDKTVQNFLPGTERSLIPGMQSRVEVITADNFDQLFAATAMDDPSVVKLYVLTIQALTAPPKPKAGHEGETKKDPKKRTRAFQEAFGAGFYDRLRAVENLVILADEFHSYENGKVFKAAIDELGGRVVVGLTATPRDPEDKRIVYRYPLAAAIAEKYVKLPTIVGRRDDRDDERTQLLDGLELIEAKRRRSEELAHHLGRRINPVMLITCQDISDAERVEALIADPTFADGRYADAVIRVDSSKADSDEDWLHLQNVENPDSHIRVIISVGMLREGWDVKNVYALHSTRASVSTMLTEQTLGRGLRLPYGRRTGIELLDTLEVLFHERYDKLIQSADKIAEEFVSYRTRSRARRDAHGRRVIERMKEKVEPVVEDHAHEPVSVPETTASSPAAQPSAPATPGPQEPFEEPILDVGETSGPARLGITDIDARLEEAAKDTQAPKVMTVREDISETLRFPVLSVVATTAEFSLTDIVDRTPFRELGRKIAADPSQFLRRTVIDAEIEEDLEGRLVTRTKTRSAQDAVTGSQESVSVTEAIRELTSAIMRSPVVSSRADKVRQERAAAREIVEELIEGLDGEADRLLAAFHARAASRLVQLLTAEQAKWRSKPRYETRVRFVKPTLSRTLTRKTSNDLTSRLPRAEFIATAFVGFQRSVFSADWFDSHPERDVARLLDAPENPIRWWLRLQNGDLPIRIDESTSNYQPDFVACDADGRMWVVEVKGDDQADTPSVKAKRDAAKRWVNVVNSNREDGDPKWGYVLAFERDVADAKDSWDALVRLTDAR